MAGKLMKDNRKHSVGSRTRPREKFAESLLVRAARSLLSLSLSLSLSL